MLHVLFVHASFAILPASLQLGYESIRPIHMHASKNNSVNDIIVIIMFPADNW